MVILTHKINVLLLTDCLADLMGGAERQIFELAKGLDKEKFNVTIASLECIGKAPSDLIEAIGCRFIDFRVKRIYGFSGLIQGIKFWKFLKKEQIQIIQTYHFSSDIWGAFIARLAGVKNIISNRRDMGFWRRQRHVWAYKFINRYVKKIIVNAEAIKTLFIQEEGADENKFEVISNGIDIQGKITDYDYSSNQFGISNDDIVIMHVANLNPVKGHSFLLEAIAQVISTHPKVKLLLIGEGPLREQITDTIDTLGLKNHVILLGQRKDARQLLTMADLCILTSSSEGMSNAILEYMSASKPVIATRVGGNPELVDDGSTGILVESESVNDLKNALLTLIGDKDKRVFMGNNGNQKVVDHYSMPKMIQTYSNLFHALVSQEKNILHLISSSGLFGAENIVLTLGQNIQGDGFSTIVGAIQDSRYPNVEVLKKVSELGIKTYTLKCNGWFDPGAVFRLKKYLVENEIDVLHTHNYKSDMIGYLAAKMAGIPVVATAHGFTDMTHRVSLYEKLDRGILRVFDKVIVVTDQVLKGFPEEKKCVISNGVNVEQFSRDKQKGSTLRKKYAIQEEDVLIGTVGRLSKEKNQKMLLEAAYPILKNNDKVKVIIVGNGPEEDTLKQLKESKQFNGRIIFAGNINDMVSVYSALNIFVLSSLTEGVPLTVLEAMAARLPIIATRVGGIPEMIDDGKNGLLIDSQNTEALRTRIEELIEHQSKRQQLAENAHDYVKTKFDLAHMCNAYKQIYNEVLN